MAASDMCSATREPALSFTQGLIVGQISVVLLIAAFIKFFIFGDPPSAEVTAAARASERRSRTLAHKESLLTLRTPNLRQPQQTLNRKKSTVLRNPPALTIGSILNKTYYNVDSHQPESLDWFNVLIAQTIAQARSDAQHDDAILNSLNKALNNGARPDFLDEIKVTELTLGEDFPILSNCRVIPVDEDGIGLDEHEFHAKSSQPMGEGTRLQARMDVDLSDMITLAIETKLLLNYPKRLTAVLPVALAVSIVRFSGTLSISFIPSNPSQSTPTMMRFYFLDDYRLEFSIRSLVGSRSRLQDVPKIAQIVEARLHRWFDERAVEPRFQEIALPSLWPRKKNTRGGEDPLDAASAAGSASASAAGSTNMGKGKSRETARDLRDETASWKEVHAESSARAASDHLRYRRTRGGDASSTGEYSMPGSYLGT
ncbi:uncharacterized protein B0I36DRAFT_283893 [Microdochium trichocladiopsis]|uniref:Maintenance of mitochondrial morphology protein 1 n=1 Tax=Microdochium trichocladiopsis TaxID=1682393 RepID=A0A9P8YC44_9PEZI|nr:uncharacterized protein B0I36DRAFT_283893 [Microdochium trichocladiopsis]KAH7038011.1 hypothetical protein B0I36DRAFT_283893 [Microdochium trichocladiopsis]